MSTDETTDICPACGHYHLYIRRPHITTPKAEKYRCEGCGHTFDTPDTRPKEHTGSIPSHSLAARLADTDASEVGR